MSLLRNADGTTRYFPLGDALPETVIDQLRTLNLMGKRRLLAGYDVLAKASGEYRRPKEGEWYLSGAIVAAYRAPKDLRAEYQIAQLQVVQTRKVVVTEVVADLTTTPKEGL